MNAMESPLEALAFSHLSADALTVIVNNLWTLIAVLSAGAISLLLRSKLPALPGSPRSGQVSSFSSLNSSKIVSPPASPPAELAAVEPDSPLIDEMKAVKRTMTAAPAACAAESGDRVTRGKFTVYYYEDCENFCNDEDFEEEYNVDGDVNGGGVAELSLVKLWDDVGKNEEMGWYRYQDLTVFNGNIVRLWDDQKKMATLIY